MCVYRVCTKHKIERKKWDTGKPNQNNLFLVTFNTVLGLCLKHLVDPLLYFLLPPQPKLTENNPNHMDESGVRVSLLMSKILFKNKLVHVFNYTKSLAAHTH